MSRKFKPKPQQLTLLGESFDLSKPHFGQVEIAALQMHDGLPPDATFVDSVARFGVVEPVVLVACAGEVALVNGRRRVCAAQMTGLTRVPALTYTFAEAYSDRLTLIAATLTMLLNELRRDNPLADVHAIAQLRAKGATDRDITQLTGMPLSRIRRREKLTRLIPDLFQAWADGLLTVRLAETCAVLPNVTQAHLAMHLASTGELTWRDVSEAREARRQQSQGVLALAGLDASLSAAGVTDCMPVTVGDIAAVISPTTARRIAAELPDEQRFDEARRLFAAAGECVLVFEPAQTTPAKPWQVAMPVTA
jgi:hypothetical protein